MSNVRRDPIAQKNGYLGVDFLIAGKNGETHLDIKAPVDSIVKLAENERSSIRKQARRISRKINFQAGHWCQPNENVTVSNSSEKIIFGIEMISVSPEEKPLMQCNITNMTEHISKQKDVPKPPNLHFMNHKE